VLFLPVINKMLRGVVMRLNKILAITVVAAIAIPLYTPVAQAVEFQVNCSSVDDCISKGDKLTKKRKLSLALEAYRNAIKMDVENKDAWRKFEKIVVRIYEEGGC
jgi:hypothetical protein